MDVRKTNGSYEEFDNEKEVFVKHTKQQAKSALKKL